MGRTIDQDERSSVFVHLDGVALVASRTIPEKNNTARTCGRSFSCQDGATIQKWDPNTGKRQMRFRITMRDSTHSSVIGRRFVCTEDTVMAVFDRSQTRILSLSLSWFTYRSIYLSIHLFIDIILLTTKLETSRYNRLQLIWMCLSWTLKDTRLIVVSINDRRTPRGSKSQRKSRWDPI